MENLVQWALVAWMWVVVILGAALLTRISDEIKGVAYELRKDREERRHVREVAEWMSKPPYGYKYWKPTREDRTYSDIEMLEEAGLDVDE